MIKQEEYAREFRRQAKAFKLLARVGEAYAETEEDRCNVAVVDGLAEVCELLAEAEEETIEEADRR